MGVSGLGQTGVVGRRDTRRVRAAQEYGARCRLANLEARGVLDGAEWQATVARIANLRATAPPGTVWLSDDESAAEEALGLNPLRGARRPASELG